MNRDLGYRLVGVIVGIAIFVVCFWFVWAVMALVPNVNGVEEWPVSLMVGVVGVALYILLMTVFLRRQQ